MLLRGLRRVGVAGTRRDLAGTGAVAAAEALGYPVALKAAAIARRGRSERAGVALDLHDAAEVGRAWRGISAELGPAALVEAVVQRMAPPGARAARRVESASRSLGPVLTFGLGGVLADAIGDRVPRLVPFAAGEAAAWSPRRGRPRRWPTTSGRIDGVIDLLERVACLADDHDELETLVINPALGSPEGAWVVDIMARVRPAPARADPVRRLA